MANHQVVVDFLYLNFEQILENILENDVIMYKSLSVPVFLFSFIHSLINSCL